MNAKVKTDSRILQNVKEMLMKDFNTVVKNNCIKDMMSFMDKRGYPYTHFIDQEDSDKRIRECFLHSFNDYIGEFSTTLRLVVRQEIWGY